MEQSLFRAAPETTITATASVPTVEPSDAVLQALIRDGVSVKIISDDSLGKKDVLSKMVPRTRALQKLLDNLDGTNTLHIRSVDNAVETLEFLIDVVNSRFQLTP